MPFISSEIRWFATERNGLWDLYCSLPEIGPGTVEAVRVDHYLLNSGRNTGVKIREGRHEIKVRSAESQQWNNGVIEHWIKWSTPEETDILRAVESRMLSDWIEVEKRRYRKVFQVGDMDFRLSPDEILDEGCSIEFSEIMIGKGRKRYFTIGFEAFSKTGKTTDNLIWTLEQLNISTHHFLNDYESISYPQLLSGV